jgi:hypothetical protein
MEEYIYRFRPIRAVLDGYHELENQEIYFASLPELNDPLEGFKDLFWKGDAIVWTNFLRQYLLCLMRTVLATQKGTSDEPVTTESMPVGTIPSELSVEVRGLFDLLCSKFFDDPEFRMLPHLLAERLSPIRRNELLSILWPAHFRILKLVCTTISPDSPVHLIDEFLRSKAEKPLRFQQSFAAQNALDRSRPESAADITEQMTARVVSAITQAIFIREYAGTSEHHGAAWNAIASSFPELYLNALERLLYFDWYTACFVADPADAAMWSTYADGHRGVCLKFRTSQSPSGGRSLALRCIAGITGSPTGSSPVYGSRSLELHQVQYLDRFSEIDFFRSLGTLTHPQLDFWFTGPDGTASSTGLDLLQEREDWRSTYWDGFHRAVTSKLTDWQHEREYRLTLHSILHNLYSERSMRKLRYSFSDLQAIIFGLKTTTQHKLQIARIIQQKSQQTSRKDFEFYQVVYSHHSGRIATTPWDLLKFE